MLRGSGQPAPPACCSRLRSAGCAVCPSRRSHTPAALSAPRSAAHTQPPLWAWPAGGSTCAGRVGSSRRRALRYGGRAAAFSCLFAGGGGVWDRLATLTAGLRPPPREPMRPQAPARPPSASERTGRLTHGRHGFAGEPHAGREARVHAREPTRVPGGTVPATRHAPSQTRPRPQVRPEAAMRRPRG